MDVRQFSSEPEEAAANRKSIFDRVFYISAFFILTFVPPALERNRAAEPPTQSTTIAFSDPSTVPAGRM